LLIAGRTIELESEPGIGSTFTFVLAVEIFGSCSRQTEQLKAYEECKPQPVTLAIFHSILITCIGYHFIHDIMFDSMPSLVMRIELRRLSMSPVVVCNSS